MALIGYTGFALGTLAAYLRAEKARGFVAVVFLAVTLLEAGLTLAGLSAAAGGVLP